MARRIAALIPFYEYDERAVLPLPTTPPEEVAARRRAGFTRLSELYRERFPRPRALTAEVSGRHLRPAVHRRLPRAVPVQPLRARASARPARSCSRRPASRSPISTATASTISPAPTASTCSATTSTRTASSAADERVARPRPGARRLSSGGRRQRAAGCARSPASTRCRSTCPAPRR